MEELLIVSDTVSLLRRTARNHTKSSRGEVQDLFSPLVFVGLLNNYFDYFFLLRFPIVICYMSKIAK